jgi:hypothetical protein
LMEQLAASSRLAQQKDKEREDLATDHAAAMSAIQEGHKHKVVAQAKKIKEQKDTCDMLSRQLQAALDASAEQRDRADAAAAELAKTDRE